MSDMITTPATARTDGAAKREMSSTTGRPTPSVAFVRWAGLGLTAGAAAFATTFFVYGVAETEIASRISDLGGLALQLGLFGLLTVMLRTGATGTSRLARGMIRFEFGLLSLATIWSVAHALVPDEMRSAIWLAVLDVFWPLSMLGMFVIAIKIAAAGRWLGLARWWPLVAESWVIVTLPAMGIGGETVGQYVGASHLVVGYVALGVILMARPHLVGARD
jgi:hypothetical protein